jgi:hypothetical protein
LLIAVRTSYQASCSNNRNFLILDIWVGHPVLLQSRKKKLRKNRQKREKLFEAPWLEQSLTRVSGNCGNYGTMAAVPAKAGRGGLLPGVRRGAEALRLRTSRVSA